MIQSFKEVEHPFVLNNYLNAFQLSVPMLVTSVTKVFSTLLKNKKWKKKNMKCLGEAKEPELEKTISHIETVEAMFSDNVDKIQLML